MFIVGYMFIDYVNLFEAFTNNQIDTKQKLF